VAAAASDGFQYWRCRWLCWVLEFLSIWTKYLKKKKQQKIKTEFSLFFLFFFCVYVRTLSIWLSSHPSINLSRFQQRASTMIFPVLLLLLLVQTLPISFPHFSAILYVFPSEMRGVTQLTAIGFTPRESSVSLACPLCDCHRIKDVPFPCLCTISSLFFLYFIFSSFPTVPSF
jgi:membrane-associated HD superfamily phosphohydrolase